MARTVLITGATSGFGAAMARRFVAAGDRVIGTGRRADRLEQLDRELGPLFLPLAFDVSDRAAVETAIAGLEEPWRAIDVLVNNAGLALGTEPEWSADLDDQETMIATNCRGLVTVTRAVLPAMVERRRGHVVNIGSIAGTVPYPGGNVYGATKAFVAQFSRNLRIDLVGTNVRVTNIEPAAAETEFSLVRFKGAADRAAAVYAGFQPLTADDVAEAVRWAVDQPPHVNVSVIELYPTAQAAGGLVYHRAT